MPDEHVRHSKSLDDSEQEATADLLAGRSEPIDAVIGELRQPRVRKPSVKLRLRVSYSMRWDELDCVSGQSGLGLWTAIKLYWQLRRGTWQDDEMFDLGDYPVFTGSTDQCS